MPESKIQVLRALLSSEPFCFWGLHVLFFTEYAYGVWQYMESSVPGQKRWTTSRVTQRALPRAYPPVTCDFRGVLGTAVPLARPAGAPDDAYPTLPEASSASTWQKRRQAGSKAGLEPTRWDEPLPHARDARTLQLSWSALASAPTTTATAPWRQPDDDAREAAARMNVAPGAACRLCGGAMDAADAPRAVACPGDDSGACASVFHLTCLAEHALAQAPAMQRTFCLPTSVSCPDCERGPVPWPTIVRRVFRRADHASDSR